MCRRVVLLKRFRGEREREWKTERERERDTHTHTHTPDSWDRMCIRCRRVVLLKETV